MLNLFKKFFLFLQGNYFYTSNDPSSNYILYKIIDYTKKDEYVLQCINSKSIFKAKLSELVFDLDILCGLHPIQACYVGIEYSFFLKNNKLNEKIYAKSIKKLKNSNNNYGKYKIKYQTRSGDFCYIERETDIEYIDDPRNICFSLSIIEKFVAEDAFYIGLHAGFMLQEKRQILQSGKSKIIQFKPKNSDNLNENISSK